MRISLNSLCIIKTHIESGQILSRDYTLLGKIMFTTELGSMTCPSGGTVKVSN